MSSSSSSPSESDKFNAQHTHNEVVNPFISFRRFADEQMATLCHSLLGLPSASGNDSSPQRRSICDKDVWVQAARNLQQHLDRESEKVEKPTSTYNRAYDKENIYGDLEDEENSFCQCPHRPSNREMPYGDRIQTSEVAPPAFGFPFLLPVHLEPSTDGNGAVSFWPMAYITSSSYSPLRLEHISPFSEHSNKWRNAFEDLMALRGGKPMLEDDSRRSNDSGAAWMVSMLERGICGEGWKNQGNPATTSENDVKEDEVTELDLYERFLESQYSPIQKSSSTGESIPKASSSTLENVRPPSLISTLTTTERNTLPDGSTYTKVVLKKRFSNGREESTETVHTTYDSQPPITSATSSNASVRETAQSATNSKEPKKNGWFWS